MRGLPMALAMGAAIGIVVAACGGTAPDGGASTGGAGATAPAAPTPVPTAEGDPGAGGGTSGGGGTGGTGGNPGDLPIVDPAEVQVVQPVAGLRDPRPVDAEAVEAAIEGDELLARVTWSSGVSPCVDLARVDVVADGTSYTLTIVEGFGPPDVACTMQLVQKATIVALGPVEAGRTYTVQATGAPDAATVTAD